MQIFLHLLGTFLPCVLYRLQILIWESSWLVASNEERNSLMGKSKESLYAATPVVSGIAIQCS